MAAKDRVALKAASTLVLTMALSACSKHHEQKTYLFYGECSVEVSAQPADADIVVDGIMVGNGSASVHIPCGQKWIVVRKAGYFPYEEYAQVTRHEPLKVKVDLKAAKGLPNVALSDETLKIAQQKGLADAAKAAGGTGAVAGPDAGGATTGPTAAVGRDNVEDWR